MKKNVEKKGIDSNCKQNTAKRVPLWVLFVSVILTAFVSGFVVLLVLSYGPMGKISLKLSQVDSLAKKYFLGELDYNELDEAVLSGYFEGLDDKYSFYENKEGAEEINNSFRGNAEGIGVSVVYEEDGSFYIFRINSGSPAEAEGLKVGDKIVSIDGKSVKTLGYEKALKALRKEIGETSKCGVLRGEERLEISFVHKEFVKQSVYYHVINEKYGYICFTEFNEATVKQFEDAVSYLTERNVEGFIFDVRDNGGGMVDSVCQILDKLVGKCDLITVEYKNGDKKVLHTSDSKETNLPMTVLTNNKTASAAELFSATIRDMKKGKLIGNTTYGKGVMQRTYTLSDGSLARFTVAEFLPAGGKSFNKVGIKPDFEVDFSDEQSKSKYKLGDSDPYIVKALEVMENE